MRYLTTVWSKGYLKSVEPIHMCKSVKFSSIDDGSKAFSIIHLFIETCKPQLMKSSIPSHEVNILNYIKYNLIHSMAYVIVLNRSRNMEILYMCITDFMGI